MNEDTSNLPWTGDEQMVLEFWAVVLVWIAVTDST